MRALAGLRWPPAARGAWQTLLVLAGRGAATALTFATGVLLARLLGPGDYGTVKTSLTVLGLLATFIDFGTSVSLVRFIPHFREQGRTAEARAVLASVFWLRLAATALLAAATLPLAGPLARLLYHQPLAGVLLLALAGAAATALLQFVSSALQSEERFGALAALGLLDAGAKTAAVLLLAGWDALAVQPVLAVYVLVPLAAALAGARSVPRQAFWTRPGPRLVADLMAYSRWNMVANSAMLIFSNMDVLMLSAMRDRLEVGYYAAGSVLAAAVGIVTLSVGTVFLPKVSRLQTAAEIGRAVRRLAVQVLWIDLALAPLALFAGPLLALLVGPAYAPAGPIARVLVADQMVMLAATPLLMAIYASNRPHIYAGVAVLELALNVAGNLAVIPRWGGLGAAWVTLAVRAACSLAGGLWFWLELARGGDPVRPVVSA